jgi:AraC family transcriptional regulator of adaptative response / DNA-3-methyladenine glycosylase II
MAMLRRGAVPGVEVVHARRYARTVQLDGGRGVVLAEFSGAGSVRIEVSASLLSGLVPTLARLRRLFDLDAEPDVVDSHLAAGGLGSLVRRRPGIRLPGVFDGFEFALFAILRDARSGGTTTEAVRQIVRELGEPVDSGITGLDRLTPTPARVAAARHGALQALGVPGVKAEAVVAVADLVMQGELRLEPGTEVHRARRLLAELDGVGEPLATFITMRALHWPDAFPAGDTTLQLRSGAAGAAALRALAERWRPWRAYAAMQLWLDDLEAGIRVAAIGKIA